MLRLGASLERIPSAYKAEIGDWMMEQIMALPAAAKPDPKTAATYARYLWALGGSARASPSRQRARSGAGEAAEAGWASC
jgi:hypothetical protein